MVSAWSLYRFRLPRLVCMPRRSIAEAEGPRWTCGTWGLFCRSKERRSTRSCRPAASRYRFCMTSHKLRSGLSPPPQVRKGVAGEASAGGAQRPLDGNGGHAGMSIKPPARAFGERNAPIYRCIVAPSPGGEGFSKSPVQPFLSGALSAPPAFSAPPRRGTGRSAVPSHHRLSAGRFLDEGLQHTAAGAEAMRPLRSCQPRHLMGEGLFIIGGFANMPLRPVPFLPEFVQFVAHGSVLLSCFWANKKRPTFYG